MPRINLPSGGWWEIKPALKHKDRREIDRRVRENAFELMKQMSGLDISAITPKAKQGATQISDEEGEAIVRVASTAWSFDGPINSETIDERDEDDFRVVLVAAIKQYQLDKVSEGKASSEQP